MHKDSVLRTLLVATAVCVVCSIFVSSASVVLKPIQQVNKALDKKKNILMAAGLYQDGIDIDEAFKQIEAKLVDLDSGLVVEGDPQSFDQRKAAKDPKRNIVLDPSQNIAGFKTRSKVAPVYFVKSGDSSGFSKIILPVHGKGLWSTMYGFIALETDLNTVAGITFYEHGETPGLGGEIDNPNWKKKWPGKKLRADGNELMLEVIKGQVDSNDPKKKYRIDGLSGATITTRGVDYLVEFWLTDSGFGKFLANLAKGVQNG